MPILPCTRSIARSLYNGGRRECVDAAKFVARFSLPSRLRSRLVSGEAQMLHYAILFFIVAIVAALLGLRGVAGLSAEIGYVLVVVAVIFLVVAFLTGRGPVPPVG